MNESSAEISFPSVRVAVTESCNLRCEYCPTDGDSVEMQTGALDTDGFKQMLEGAVKAGFTDFSFTGGEPLLTPQTAERTFELAGFVNDLRTDANKTGYTKLNTNGANLLRYQKGVVEANFSELKVSLDTLNPATFSSLAKRGEKVFQETVDGILVLKDTIPIRLQTIIGKYNINELPNILSFCIENGLDIKLFDISRYDNALAGSAEFADLNYVSLSEISEALEQTYGAPTIKYAVGGYGHGKKVFTTPEGTKIELRDTANSTHYSSGLCEDCPKYQCQDGLCNLVIAADGHIRFCREGGEKQTISSKDNLGALKSPEEIRSHFIKAAGIFAAAQSIERQVIPRKRYLLPLTVIT